MRNRRRKRNLGVQNARSLQCEQLESRLPFAVDYMDLTDVGLYAIPTNETPIQAIADLSSNSFIDDWSTDSQAVFELGYTGLGEIASSQLTAFDDPNPAMFEFWGDAVIGDTRDQDTLGLSTSIVLDPLNSQPVPTGWTLDITPSLTPSDALSVWFDADHSDPIIDPLGMMETVSIVNSSAGDEWGTAIALPASDGEVSSFLTDDVLSTGDEVWWGLSQGQPQQGMTFGQTPFFEATIVPAILLRTGPALDAFSMSSGQSNFGEEVFLFVAVTTDSADPIPTTIHRGETMPSVTNTMIESVADFPWSIDSHRLGSQILFSADASSQSKSEMQFSQLYSLVTQFAALERAVFQSTAHYQSLDTLNDALWLDVELEAQLPVRKAKGERSGNWNSAAEKNAMLPGDIHANAIIVGLPSSLLPAGMLSIGTEPERSILRGTRSYMNEEHFIVQTTMICENLQRGPLTDATVSRFIVPSGTEDSGITESKPEESGPSGSSTWDSFLSNQSLGVIAVSCVVVMAQSNLWPANSWPSKLNFRKSWLAWLNGGTEDSAS